MIPAENYRIEPYRFLFALGLLHLLWGLGIWFMFSLGFVGYPGQVHARAMIEGFLLSFSMGFLMTAIPRFSSTRPASWPEAIAAGVIALFAGLFDAAAVAAMVFLVSFGFRRRIFSSRVRKPPFFVFIQGGLFFGLAGAIIKSFFPAELYAFKSWLYEGMMLMWLCGIGSRILAMLLDPGTEPLGRAQNWAVFGLLFAGAFVQPFDPALARWGDLARLAAIGYLSFRVWKIHSLPFGRGSLAWGVWMGIVFLNLGHAIRFAKPELGLHAAHLIFIGGFCTLALMVAVRVSIAHSGDSLQLEKKYSRVTISAGILALAAITRFSAGILKPEHYFHHLLYAALAVFAAIPLWASVVLPRLRRDDGGEDHGSLPIKLKGVRS